MWLGLFFYERHVSPPPSVAADTCLLDECLRGSVTYPIDALEEQERVALIELGLEQVRLETVVGLLAEHFGPTLQPFSTVWRIEQQQTIALKSVFDKYAVAEPKLPLSGLGDALATSRRAGCVQALDQARYFQERVTIARNSFGRRADIRRFLHNTTEMYEQSVFPALEGCAKEE